MNKKMPFVIGAAILLAVFGLIVYLSAASGKTGRSDTRNYVTGTSRPIATNFTARDIFNKTSVSLQMYSNQVVLLNFWATWCPPCKLEIPELVHLYQKYKGKFVVIGVSVDQDGPEVVKAFYKEHKMNFPVIMATSVLVAAYGGITAIPTSFVIDKTGRIAEMIVGYRTEEQYEELIKANF